MRHKHIILAVLVVCVAAFYASAQDRHRPACSTAACRRVQSYVKAHYCGESPFGEGPKDGCEIKFSTKPSKGVALAAYSCEWNAVKQESECKQSGQPSD